jgi:hypothetical protein
VLAVAFAFARDMNVIYWEEPVDIGPNETAYLRLREAEAYPNIRFVVPHLPAGMSEDARDAALKRLLDAHTASVRGELIAWYYTPMMLPFSRTLDADLTVYDAMDELSKFRFAPPKLLELEQELIDRPTLFTGGTSLYEAKKHRHLEVHCFPSSVDGRISPRLVLGFRSHRPEDLPGRGSILRRDRRAPDIERSSGRGNAPRPVVRDGRPGGQNLRRRSAERPNIHLGGKTYAELPAYLSGWDVALMPFAMNDRPVHFADQDPEISPAAAACRLRSGTSCAITGISKASRSPRPRTICGRLRSALELARTRGRLARRSRSDALRRSWDTTWPAWPGLSPAASAFAVAIRAASWRNEHHPASQSALRY